MNQQSEPISQLLESDKLAPKGTVSRYKQIHFLNEQLFSAMLRHSKTVRDEAHGVATLATEVSQQVVNNFMELIQVENKVVDRLNAAIESARQVKFFALFSSILNLAAAISFLVSVVLLTK